MKKIGHSDIIGQRGISHIEGVVLSMGYMFYPTGGVKAGIDGYIELRDAQTGVVGFRLRSSNGPTTLATLPQAMTLTSWKRAPIWISAEC